jgi:CheY-like chemotaxis protein
MPRPVSVTVKASSTRPDALPRLFGAFEQADQSITRQFGGTGLGLAISQRLANLMGGRIAVRSALGEGSVFTLTVPARVCETTPSTRTAPASAVGQSPGGLRILVAEDNLANRKIVEAFLSPLEAAITFAHNGVEALEALGSQAFDLVLMDVQMPLMDGVEATRRLRASSGPNASLPVIALTANVMEDQLATYRSAGMDAQVAKPIEADQLLATIAELVHAGRAPAAPAAAIRRAS